MPPDSIHGLATTFTEHRNGFDARGRDAPIESGARVGKIRPQRQISMAP
jgi:hypothetical protein